jgi:hypothetical protein
MWLAMIAFWALPIWAIYALVTGIVRRPGQAERGRQRQPGDARRILDERLARLRGRSTPRSTSGCATFSTAGGRSTAGSGGAR